MLQNSVVTFFLCRYSVPVLDSSQPSNQQQVPQQLDRQSINNMSQPIKIENHLPKSFFEYQYISFLKFANQSVCRIFLLYPKRFLSEIY